MSCIEAIDAIGFSQSCEITGTVFCLQFRNSVFSLSFCLSLFFSLFLSFSLSLSLCLSLPLSRGLSLFLALLVPFPKVFSVLCIGNVLYLCMCACAMMCTAFMCETVSQTWEPFSLNSRPSPIGRYVDWIALEKPLCTEIIGMFSNGVSEKNL